MNRPGDKELTALLRLRGDMDFRNWCKASLETYRDDTMMQRDETSLRVAQGKAQVLAELLDLIEQAPDLLTKRRRD